MTASTPASPRWCSPEAFQVYVDTFERKQVSMARSTVFATCERNWNAPSLLAGKQINQPALFIIGDADPVASFEAYTIKEDAHCRCASGTACDWPDCGPLIQCEKPEAVNSLLLTLSWPSNSSSETAALREPT